MASGFPGSIDNFTDPLTTSALNSPSHAGQHQDLNDAVEKIETYMGLVKVIPTGATNGTVTADGDVTIGNAVSSVSVTCFSDLYDNYKITISGGAASTPMVLKMTLGATVTGYYYTFVYTDFDNTADAAGAANATGFVYAAEGQSDGMHGCIELFAPYLAKRTRIFNGISSGSGTGYAGTNNGFLNNTTSYTAFTLTPNTGTITGGTIRVYGYRN